VILTVAITVILAAMIGTFVLGFGENIEGTSPNAQFNTEFDEGTPPSSGWHPNGDIKGNTLEITHQSGPKIDSDRLTITKDGSGESDWQTDCEGSTDSAPAIQPPSKPVLVMKSGSFGPLKAIARLTRS
jgi:hypothetical protein